MKYIMTILACLFAGVSCEARADDKAIIIASAASMGISRPVIEKVAGRESGFNCHAYNRSSGASGPLQILPSSARALGYGNGRATAALRSCGMGLTAGLKHLRACVDVVGQNPARAAYCHNFGLGAVTHRHYASAHRRHQHYASAHRHRRHYAMR